MSLTLTKRMRRLRVSSAMRNLVQENHILAHDLIMPLFVIEGTNVKEPISSMPNMYRYSLDLLIKECKELYQLGVQAIVLFPCISDSKKDKLASEAMNQDGLYLRALQEIKQAIPDLLVITDIAMDPYSTDGHDGFVNDKGEIENDRTIEILQNMALAQAQAGADILAPSDMMDGRIGAIRRALDQENYTNTNLLSYSAKYASAFYGPFRDALSSAPKKGDKKTYQMNPANSQEAIREVELDLQEGADIVMVKPGLPYLDIIRIVKDRFQVPVAAYNVSGEYAMLCSAAQNGWLDYQACAMETLLSFKRAGADMILTYHAKEAATWLQEV